MENIVVSLCNSGVIQSNNALAVQFNCGSPHWEECQTMTREEDPQKWEDFMCDEAMKGRRRGRGRKMKKALMYPALNILGYVMVREDGFADTDEWSQIQTLQLANIGWFVLAAVMNKMMDGAMRSMMKLARVVPLVLNLVALYLWTSTSVDHNMQSYITLGTIVL